MTERPAVTSRAWLGEVINGKFRITQYLGGSEHSSVFLAEYGERNGRAAVKIIPVEAKDPSRISQIQRIATLGHPHLLSIFEAGYCQTGDSSALYVAMEYAEENLCQVLSERSLSEEETRQMLSPMLEVLAFLHGRGFVYGALKPSNIMASGDQLKLAPDCICAAGSQRVARVADPHDAPETAAGELTPAADMWSLGTTIVEVLTQRLPEQQGPGEWTVPPTLPFPFPQIARRCMAMDPAQRWNVADVSACLPIGAQARKSPQVEPTATHTTWRYPAIAVAALAVIAVLFFLPRGTREPERTRVVQALPPQQPAPTSAYEEKPSAAQLTVERPAASSAPVVQEAREAPSPAESVRAAVAKTVAAPERTLPKSEVQPVTAAPGIVHQAIPEIPHKAMATIQGTLRNSVRVTVDPAGTVRDARMEAAGPSRYFATFSQEASRQWKFEPGAAANDWIISFEFRRDGITAKAARATR